MPTMTINSDSLTDIADSIRAKLGVETTYLPSEMAAAIDSITGGGVTQEDNGKVVVNGQLVAQTATSVEENGTYDTTTNDSVVVDVPNSYTAADEGKVVSSGQLAAQTSLSVTQNGTYDTTTNGEVVVDVSGGGGEVYDETPVNSYIVNSPTPTNNANSAVSGGFSFTSSKTIRVTKVRVFPRSTAVNVHVFRGATEIANVMGAAVTPGEWNEISLSSPLVLDASETYTVSYSHPDGTACKYYNSGTQSSISYITKTNVYGTTRDARPTFVETTSTYAIDLYVDAYLTPREAVLIDKSITQNGTYSAEDDDADGYSEVTVNVAGGEYVLVEWIQSDGTQAIDTGERTTAETEIYVDASATNESGKYLWLFGLWPNETAGDNEWIGTMYSNGSAVVVYKMNMFVVNGSQTGVRAIISITPTVRSFRPLNGSASSSSTGTMVASNDTMPVFGIGYYQGGEYVVAQLIKATLYKFSINGKDFYPCKRISDGAYGLYNTTDKTFHGDVMGGNPFTAGEEIAPIG